MHVLIAGLPRTRTSFLCSAYSNYYKMANFHEILDSNYVLYELKNKKSEIKPDLIKMKKEKLLLDFESIFKKEKSVVKLFPRHFMIHYAKNSFESLKDFQFNVIDDISEIFQLNKFDEIVLVERNIVESVTSYAYGKSIGHLLYTKSFSQMDWIKKKYSSVLIQEEMFPNINFIILEYIIYQDLKKFISKNYSPIYLTYDNSVDFVKERFNNLEDNFYQDPGLDYKSLIKNYNQVADYINKTLEDFSKIYTPINFK